MHVMSRKVFPYLWLFEAGLYVACGLVYFTMVDTYQLKRVHDQAASFVSSFATIQTEQGAIAKTYTDQDALIKKVQVTNPISATVSLELSLPALTHCRMSARRRRTAALLPTEQPFRDRARCRRVKAPLRRFRKPWRRT